MAAGFDHARGDVIVPMDGDRQNDPADIGRSSRRSTRATTSSAAGARTARTRSSRRLPSRIANWLIGRVTGVRLHDYGCTLKAYRAEVMRETRLYGEMHRFLPALAYQAGARITEIPVTHHPRVAGKSNYGLGRTFKVLLDLMTVKFLSVWATKPSYVFGGSGVVLCLLGSAFVIWTAYQKIFNGVFVYRQPSLLVGVFLFTIGLNLILLGLLAELIVRTHHESQSKPRVPRARAPQLRGARAARVAVAPPHVRDLRDGRPRAGRPRRARAHDRRAAPPRARRRGLPRRELRRRRLGRARIPAAVDHRPRHRATSRSRTRTARVQVVFNGEIYNFRELRAELEARGHRFATSADTEVIVHLYEELGRALRRAAERHVRVRALGRARTRELLLARDRFGKKPLYYAELDGALLFGSELKALARASGAARASSTSRASSRYLALEYVPTPRAIFEGVRKLPAAHTSSSGSDGRADVERYWDLVVRARRRRRGATTEYAEELRDAAAGGRAAAARQRRAARRVPERRHRLELGRRVDGRGAPGRSREDVLDRLRRARASTSRRTRGAWRSTSAPTTTRTSFTPSAMARPAPDGRGRPRRAVRRRVGPADLPALPLHARARHRRARRRRRRRAARRLPDVPGRPRRAPLPRAARSCTSASSSRSPTGCRSRRPTSASTSSSSGSCAARGAPPRTAIPSGSARSRRRSSATLLRGPPATRAERSATAFSRGADATTASSG